jgi:hypothetical protein
MAFVYFTAVDPTNVGEANPQLANYMEPPVAAAAVQVDYTPVQEAAQDDETDGYDANAYAAAAAAVGLRNAAAMQQPLQAEAAPQPVSMHTTPLEQRIQLLRRENSGSGWYGVTLEKKGSASRPYLAQIRRNGRQVKLGRFETGEEAAHAYAEAMTPEDLEKLCTPGRHGRHASTELVPQLSTEAALAQAKAEGLTLHEAPGTKTGYRGVAVQQKSAVSPFMAVLQRNGKSQHLGCYATKEHAALVYARAAAAQPTAHPGTISTPQGPPAEPDSVTPSMSAEDAVAKANEEGLTLHLASKENSATGFKGVWKSKRSKAKPFRAEFRSRKLGRFFAAEGAALAFARAEAFCKATPCGSSHKCMCLLPWLPPPQPSQKKPRPEKKKRKKPGDSDDDDEDDEDDDDKAEEQPMQASATIIEDAADGTTDAAATEAVPVVEATLVVSDDP